MAQTKARLYKYVTPPSFKGGGITVKIGDKVVTQPEAGVVKNIKAINSLGATTNSIAILVEDLNVSMKGFFSKTLSQQQALIDQREDNIADEKKRQKKLLDKAAREKGLERDKKSENLQERKGAAKKSVFAERSKKVAAGAFGFLKGLAGLFGTVFKTMILYSLMDWLSKPENTKKIKKFLEGIKAIGTWFINTYGFLVGMGLDGVVEFMENPISFQGVFGLLKFVTALGLIFAPAAVAKLGLGLLFKLMGKGGSGAIVKGIVGFAKMFFGAVTGVVKGLIGFLRARGLMGAGLTILGGAALFTAAGAFDDQLGATDEDINEQVEEDGKEEVIKSLEEQLAGLNAWDKLWGKENAIKEQIERLKTGERKSYGQTGNNAMSKIPIIGGLFGGGGEEKTEPVPEGKAVGGRVKGKYAKGGWISGPMSGYPVSLDGGATTSFIGHGTEWVGRRAAGGDAFVVPFNTPATGGKNGLTSMRMQQAKAGGYSLPGFAKGGKLSGTQNPRRDGSQEENRLAQKDLAKKAAGGKIFLHWTAGGGNFKQSGKYHSIVQGDGSIYRAHPYDQRSGVAHTYLRNSSGIGMSVAAMAGSPGSYQWPSGKQIDSLSAEIADVAKKRGWKESDISVKNIMTHAEAASGKDGELPRNDNYGPTAWGGDGARWDLWHLTKDGKPGSGGHIIRNKVRGFLGMEQIPVPEDAGSPSPAQKAASKGSTQNDATKNASQSGSDDSGGGGFDMTKQYLSTDMIMQFFTGKSGMLSQYIADAQGGNGATATPKTTATMPFNTDLDLGITADTFKSDAKIDFTGGSTVDFSTAMTAGEGFTDGMDLSMSSGINTGMSVGGAFCPWCKKKRSAGGAVNWDPVLKVIGDVEGDWNSVNPGHKADGLEKMTIREARDKALTYKGGTSAMGKYQFLPLYKGTNPLKRTADMSGLDYDKDLFSPANQKKMAITRIMHDRRGKDWLSGKLSDDAFQKLLASEWAGLAYYKDGRGRYDSSTNKAKASWQQVRSAMMAAKSGGYPDFDPKKKYKVGDVVKKDGSLKVFDGMGWGAFDGGVTSQGTSEQTLAGTSAGSFDEASGNDTSNAEGEEKKDLGSKIDLLAKYVADAQDDGGGGFQWESSAFVPKASQSGEQLATKQQNEDAAKMEKENKTDLSSTTLPAAGAGGGAQPDPGAEAQVASSGPYIIPANEYVRPRFGLTAEIFAEPVSIA